MKAYLLAALTTVTLGCNQPQPINIPVIDTTRVPYSGNITVNYHNQTSPLNIYCSEFADADSIDALAEDDTIIVNLRHGRNTCEYADILGIKRKTSE